MSAEVSRASGSRFGGVASHWLGELEILADSMPTLRNVTLTYNELGTLVYVTERLLRSAPALEAYVRKAALDDQQWEINRAIVAGSGVGQPLGILNSAALITTPLPEPTSTALTVADVNAMYSRLLPQCRPNAVWLFHPDLLEQLEALNIESPGGATLWPIFLPASGGVVSLSGTPIPLSGGTATLKGRPMIESEACNAPGNPGDLVLADLSMVAAIVRGSFEMSSPHVRFEMRQSAFRFITDFESQPLINSPIAPASGTLTRSPFVVLAERLP
jgi:HK97 family phage major capsid protein